MAISGCPSCRPRPPSGGPAGLPRRGRYVIPRDLAQGAILGQPVGERPEGQVDELVKRYRSAQTGPERHAGAEHPGGRGGQQPRIGIPLRVGAEPLGEPFSDGSFDHRHLRRVGRAHVRVGTGLLHPAQPVRRIAAELGELIGHRQRLAGHDDAQRIQPGLAGRLMHEALAQGRDPVLVGAEQRGFLGREVVEERARRHVGRLGDVLHGDVREAALGDQVERHPAERPAGGQLLALAQRGARLPRGRHASNCHRALTATLHLA